MKKKATIISIIIVLISLGVYGVSYEIKNKNTISPKQAMDSIGKDKSEVFKNLGIGGGKKYLSSEDLDSYLYDYKQNIMDNIFSKAYINFKDGKMSSIQYENEFDIQLGQAAYLSTMKIKASLSDKYGSALNDKVYEKKSFLQNGNSFLVNLKNSYTKKETNYLSQYYWKVNQNEAIALIAGYLSQKNSIVISLMYYKQ